MWCKQVVSFMILSGLLLRTTVSFFAQTTKLTQPITHIASIRRNNCIRSSTLIMSKRKGSTTTSASKKAKATAPEDDSSDVIVPLPFCPVDFNATRARVLTDTAKLNERGNCVVVWMSRDQRAEDNHALHYAQGVAKSVGVPLKVVFNLVPTFLGATLRQYSFMIDGLREVEQSLRDRGIPLHLLQGDPCETIPSFVKEHNAVVLVADFSPLRVGRSWVESVAQSLDAGKPAQIPLVQVDAHNIVPCWVASPKLEYGARTIRSKIQRLLPDYLKPIPPLEAMPAGGVDCDPVDWAAVLRGLAIDRSVPPVAWIRPGPAAAFEMLRSFIDQRLKIYGDKRNDPNENALSHLSPYFHFGHISAQRAVLEVKMAKKHASSADGFVEESVVRRELADNFCYCEEVVFDACCLILVLFIAARTVS